MELGKSCVLPALPSVGGNEGVGKVVQLGSRVSSLKCGERVIVTASRQGTWRTYGIYSQEDLHCISQKLPIPDACMLSEGPCQAHIMLKNFCHLEPGQTVIQNGASSACGQSVIQLCKLWGIQTINLLDDDMEYSKMKDYLMSLGATLVLSTKEAQNINDVPNYMMKPTLGLNCLDGIHEQQINKLLEPDGIIVNYGYAYNNESGLMTNVERFRIADWYRKTPLRQITQTLHEISILILLGKLNTPIYESVELEDYIEAIKNISSNLPMNGKRSSIYVFDLSLD